MKNRALKPALATCTLPLGGTVTVQLGETGRTFIGGDTVDLSAEAAPGLTWRDALGFHADVFTEASASVSVNVSQE